jgi:hypothetical protein
MDIQKKDKIMAQLIQTAMVNKTSVGELIIHFEKEFKDAPTVVVTPVWRQEVGYSEIIKDSSSTQFTVVSKNAAAEYHVSWIAIGEEK